MKVTIYTTADCPFSKQEKDYLTSKNIAFEEKDVEKDRAFLAEMLVASDKFSAVPFTVVVKDDGSEVKLKGFTQEEFDKALVTSATPTTTTATPTITTTPSPTAAATTTPATPQKPDELKGILDNLVTLSNDQKISTPAGQTPSGGQDSVQRSPLGGATLSSNSQESQKPPVMQTPSVSTPPASTPPTPATGTPPQSPKPSIPDFPTTTT